MNTNNSLDYHHPSNEMEQAWEAYIQAYPNDYKSVSFVAFMAGWNAANHSSYHWIEQSDFDQIPENSWCWCLLKPSSNDSSIYVIPAVRSTNSAGGWTNHDTWQDFDHQIIAACIIPPPSKCSVRRLTY